MKFKMSYNSTPPHTHIRKYQRKLLFAGWIACLRSSRYRAYARSG